MQFGNTRIAFLLLVVLVLIPPRSSQACDCPVRVSIQDDIDFADFVFLGMVVQVRDEVEMGFTNRAVSLDVMQSWKGIGTRQVIVIEQHSPASCFPSFEVGELFLVYARLVPELESVRTHVCWGSSKLCSGYNPGLPDIRRLEELGIPPLLADGLAMQEIEGMCESSVEDEADPTDSILPANPTACGAMSAVPLFAICMAFPLLGRLKTRLQQSGRPHPPGRFGC